MSLAVIMVGAIAAGKTTVARALAERHGLEVVSPDDHMERPWTPEKSLDAWCRCVAEQYRLVKTGRSYVLDTASRLPRMRREAVAVVKAWSPGDMSGPWRVVAVWARAPLSLCLQRNERRENPESEAVVRDYWDSIEVEPPAAPDGFDAVRIVNTGASPLFLPEIL